MVAALPLMGAYVRVGGMVNIKTIEAPHEIALCYETFFELRPQFVDQDTFVSQVLIQQKEGYQITAVLCCAEIVACMGFRMMTTLAFGKILYIDDLISREIHRGKGYGRMLLDHAVDVARESCCLEIHLDTGYTRHSAHKTYLRHGFELICHHMSRKI